MKKSESDYNRMLKSFKKDKIAPSKGKTLQEKLKENPELRKKQKIYEDSLKKIKMFKEQQHGGH